ncbi:MAG: hypothetical protein SFY32_06620 [Bacteroidota bacterium]|nr:hypothetical protein [Bacteroidota bacterium]
MNKYFIVVIITFCSFHSFAQHEYSVDLKKAYDEFLKLRVDSGVSILKKYEHKHKNNGVAILLENYADVIRLAVSENPDLYEVLKKNEKIRIQNIEKIDPKSPYHNYILGEIYLQWGIIKAKFGNEVEGARDIVRAYNLFQENEKKFPDFIYHKKSLGALHIILGSIPDNYKWVARMLGFNPDILLGIKEMKQVFESNNAVRSEAFLLYEGLKYFLLKERREEPVELNRFLGNNSDNLAAMYLYVGVLRKFNRGEMALVVLDNFQINDKYINFPYNKYIKGNLLLQKGKYEEAAQDFKVFIDLFDGKNYKKDACYKIFLAYSIQGKTNEALEYFNYISEIGQAVTEPDKIAEKAAKEKPYMDVRLVRARLLCDGGYITEAASILHGLTANDFPNQKDKTEFYYRIGKIYELRKEEVKAIPFYEKAIKIQGNEKYYFAPNACLTIGYILLKTDPQKAYEYFKRVFEYSDYEYEGSINAKAKAALHELKK